MPQKNRRDGGFMPESVGELADQIGYRFWVRIVHALGPARIAGYPQRGFMPKMALPAAERANWQRIAGERETDEPGRELARVVNSLPSAIFWKHREGLDAVEIIAAVSS